MLWFLPLGAVIVALYLLRMRRRDVQVPAVFLWPERTEEVRANSLFQRLRFSWLLLLQLLALLATVLALSVPQFLQRGLAGKVTVVVLDASASMGATDVAPSRFLVARGLVADMIGTAAPGDRLALIEAGPVPRVVFPLSSDPTRQRDLLRTVQKFDSEADMGEALRLASAVAGNNDAAKIVVISDGVFERVVDFSPGKAAVVYQSVGKSEENLAVQALGTAVSGSGRVAYCGVKNMGVQPAKTVVDMTVDGKIVDSANAVIGPGQVWGKTVAVPAGAKVVEAKLRGHDFLSADDTAVALTDPGASIRALLVTKGDLFLEKALALDPRVTLDRATSVPESESGESGESAYDLVVFDGVREVPVKARAVLTFGEAGTSSPVSVKGSVKAPTFVDAETVPLLEGVDFSDVYIESMQRVAAKGAGRVVAECKEGPLVVAAQGRKRQVYVAFSPMDSDFPLNIGFPILVGNALDFLIGRESSDMVSVRVGQPFAIPANGARSGTLTYQDGTSVDVPARDGRVIVRETRSVGQYVLAVGTHKQTVYATMRSPTESSIKPHGDLEVGAVKVKSTGATFRFEDLWRPALLFALFVLGTEWWLYARRL
ncbi:MAG: BatA and WFA domain-containing protein [Armatimonadetes bacterium]|nr:BatA and WFA domain-containing protein [Armatimonadota bacterium]